MLLVTHDFPLFERSNRHLTSIRFQKTRANLFHSARCRFHLDLKSETDVNINDFDFSIYSAAFFIENEYKLKQTNE